MRSRQSGFTLIEVALVVTIIGIVAVLAIQTYRMYLSRARRVESYAGLSAIWKAQTGFFASEGRYANNFDELAFDIGGGTRLSSTEITGGRYTYKLSQPWGRTSMHVTGTGNIDDDDWEDIITAEAGRPPVP